MIFYQRLLKALVCALSLAMPLSVTAQTKIAVLSDIHVMNPQLVKSDGMAWQNALSRERKLLDYSHEAFDMMVEKFLTDKPHIVLITGDLTKDGEQASHEYVVDGLDKLRRAGISVYVIPGNHDLGTANALIYDGGTTTKAPVADAAAFEELYQPYGYGTTSTREATTLTYACEPVAGLVLIGIDSGKSGVLSDTTLDWVCQQAGQARNQGKRVIAMMHHPLFPHVTGADKLSSTYSIKDHEKIRNRLVDAGIRIILTGHVHVSDIAKDYNAVVSDSIYDVNTGSTISYPCDYRMMTLSQDLSQLSIQTGHITSLPSDNDYTGTAKKRYQDYVKGYASTFISNDMYGQILAAIATIHAEGNENLSADAKSFLSLYDMAKVSLQANATFNDALKARGGTWEDADAAINSMLQDISSYGIERRADQTDDLELTIHLPKSNDSATGHVKGDIDRNGEVNITDAVALVSIILDKGQISNRYWADIDGSGMVNIGDTVELIRFILGD